MDPTPLFCARTEQGAIVGAHFVGDQNTILVFNRCGKFSWIRFRPKPKQFTKQISKHPISAVAFSNSCEKIIVGDETGSFFALSKKGEILSKTYHKQSARIVKIEFTPDSTVFASASEDGTVKLFQTSDYAMLMQFYDHQGLILDCSFSSDGDTFITSCSDQRIRLFSLKTGKLKKVLGPYPVAPSSLVYETPGRSFYAGFMNGIVAGYDVESGASVFCQRVHMTSVTCMRMHPSHLVLLTAAADKGLSIVDLRKNREFEEIKAHKAPVSYMTWDPCGHYFITADTHGAVLVWHYPEASGLPQVELNSKVESLACHANDGKEEVDESSSSDHSDGYDRRKLETDGVTDLPESEEEEITETPNTLGNDDKASNASSGSAKASPQFEVAVDLEEGEQEVHAASHSENELEGKEEEEAVHEASHSGSELEGKEEECEKEVHDASHSGSELEGKEEECEKEVHKASHSGSELEAKEEEGVGHDDDNATKTPELSVHGSDDVDFADVDKYSTSENSETAEAPVETKIPSDTCVHEEETPEVETNVGSDEAPDNNDEQTANIDDEDSGQGDRESTEEESPKTDPRVDADSTFNNEQVPQEAQLTNEGSEDDAENAGADECPQTFDPPYEIPEDFPDVDATVVVSSDSVGIPESGVQETNGESDPETPHVTDSDFPDVDPMIVVNADVPKNEFPEVKVNAVPPSIGASSEFFEVEPKVASDNESSEFPEVDPKLCTDGSEQNLLREETLDISDSPLAVTVGELAQADDDTRAERTDDVAPVPVPENDTEGECVEVVACCPHGDDDENDDEKETSNAVASVDGAVGILNDWDELKRRYPLLASFMEEDGNEPEISDSEMEKLLARILNGAEEEQSSDSLG